MRFQPDLAGFKPLSMDAPFPARLQGEWVDAETGLPAMTISGRTVTIDSPMPVHELFKRYEDGHMVILNTLTDTSKLDPDWAERTVYLFHLDDRGSLSITGFCDYWTLVRREAIDPAEIMPRISPYHTLALNEDFPQLLQGRWRGASHGQDVFIGSRQVLIDGEPVDFLTSKLIRVIPSDDAPICSLVLNLDKEAVVSRFGAETLPMVNFIVFRSGKMQGAGPGLRDSMFTRAAG